MLAKIEYPTRIVAFIDLLGFSDLICAADKEESVAVDKISRLEAIMSNEVMKWGELTPDQTGHSLRMFSDCISMATYPTIGGFLTTLVRLMGLQARLISKGGILVRGGIALGRHYESDRMIFSQGLVTAYRLETQRSIFPRIIVASNVLCNFIEAGSAAEKEIELVKGLLLRDTDGEVFIDYLALLGDDNFRKSRTSYIQQHKNLVVEGRKAHAGRPRILQKIGWVARYHDFVLQRLGPQYSYWSVNDDASGFSGL